MWSISETCEICHWVSRLHSSEQFQLLRGETVMPSYASWPAGHPASLPACLPWEDQYMYVDELIFPVARCNHKRILYSSSKASINLFLAIIPQAITTTRGGNNNDHMLIVFNLLEGILCFARPTPEMHNNNEGDAPREWGGRGKTFISSNNSKLDNPSRLHSFRDWNFRWLAYKWYGSRSILQQLAMAEIMKILTFLTYATSEVEDKLNGVWQRDKKKHEMDIWAITCWPRNKNGKWKRKRKHNCIL